MSHWTTYMAHKITLKWLVFVKAQRSLAAPGWMCIRGIRGRVPNLFAGRRHAAAAVGGGVALFCCSGEIWHGAERGRGREWGSLIGINGSSEVWTENLRMGSNDWKQNGKRQTCVFFCFFPHTHTHKHTATGRFMAHLIVNTIGYHCRQVHLPLCEYVPRCIQLQVPCEYLLYFRSKANTSRPQISSTVWDETLAGVSELKCCKHGCGVESVCLVTDLCD